MGFGFSALAPTAADAIPDPSAAPPQAQAPAQAPAQGQSYAPSKFDIFMDMLFNGHTPADAALKVRQRDYGVQQSQMLMQALQHASPDQRAAMILNGPKYGEEVSKNYAPQTGSAGQRIQYFGPNGPAVDVPTTGISTGGQPYAISPQGISTFGSQLPGGVEAKDGLVIDKNLGPVGTYATPQTIAPGSTGVPFTPTLNGGPAPGPGLGAGSPGVAGGPGAPGPGAGAGPVVPTGPDGRVPVGIRNLNFGNLKTPASGPWKGQVGVDQAGHAIFADPQSGVAAARDNLLSYAKNGVNTINGVVAKWAPTSKNLQPYATFVAASMGVKPDQKIDLTDPKVQQGVLKGIFNFENSPQAMAAFRYKGSIAPQPGQGGAPGGGQGAPQGAGYGAPFAQGAKPRILTPQEAQQDHYAPGAVIEQDAAGHKTVSQAGYAPDQIFNLRKQVTDTDEYKNYKEAKAAYGAMVSAAAQPSGGMRAYALRDTFARTVNPKGAVRVGTIEALKEAQGIPANIKGYLMNLKGDGNVPPEIAQQILDVSRGFLAAHYRNAQDLNDNVVDFAKRKGIDPGDVQAPLGDAPSRMVLGPVPPAAKRAPGTIYVTPKGPLLWTGSGAKPWKAIQ